MREIRVLVTAVGGDIGGDIVNILKAQESMNFYIVGTDINQYSFHSDEVNSFYKVSRCSEINYKTEILEIIEKENIELIIPVSEYEILWFDEHRELFKKYTLLLNNSAIVSNFLDKLTTSKELEKIGVKTPKTYLLSEFKNQIDFPLFVKATYGVTSKERYHIKSAKDLELLLQTLGEKENYIVQEYIGTNEAEFTTGVYSSGAKTEVISFQRRLTGSKTSFAEIANEKILKQYGESIAKAFDLKGSINIQSRLFNGKFYVFEINPRFSSTIFIRNHFGFQDLIWWIEDSLGVKISKNESRDSIKKGKAVLGYQYKFFQ